MVTLFSQRKAEWSLTVLAVISLPSLMDTLTRVAFSNGIYFPGNAYLLVVDSAGFLSE